MVRDAIARQGGQRSSLAPAAPNAHLQASASFGLLPVARGDDGDGSCLIEPAVRCNHCGYCVSYGH